MATSFLDGQRARSWASAWRDNKDDFDEGEEEEDTSNALDITGVWSILIPIYSERFGVDGPFAVQLFSSRPNPRSYTLWGQFDFNAFKGFFRFAEGQRPALTRMSFEWRGEDTVMRTPLPVTNLRGWIEFLDEDELRGHIEGPDIGRYDFEGRKVQKLDAVLDHAAVVRTWDECKAEPTPEELAVSFGAMGRFGLSS